ncbi:MAG: DsbA family protein [Hyphomicrobiaceae bacterium]|nr:MAG: DsbA family protein [Hyphomicrobiaceae bacterium]
MPDAKQITPLLLAAVAFVLISTVAAWLVLGPRPGEANRSIGSPAAMPDAEFERRVRAYLLGNPEIIAEALQQLERRQQLAEATEAQGALKMHAEELLRDPASPVGGNPKGDVSLVEFFDYNCPYCRQVAPHMAKAEANDPKLRIVYKEFPILGPNSTFAAKAALAAHRQGKYVAFHQALMELKGPTAEKTVLETAGRLGLDLDRLKGDMADPAIEAAINRNLALARALRINGTPGFVIGKEIVRGAMDLATMEGLIQQARGK